MANAACRAYANHKLSACGGGFVLNSSVCMNVMCYGTLNLQYTKFIYVLNM